jgi:uncharacterized membrane protein YhiD involved in acid resistance
MACGFGFYALAFTIAIAGLLVLTVLGFITARLAPERVSERDQDQAPERPRNPSRLPGP